jgi:hypothetical protein
MSADGTFAHGAFARRRFNREQETGMSLRYVWAVSTATMLGAVLTATGASQVSAQGAPVGLNTPVDAHRPVDKASDRSGEFEPWQSGAQQGGTGLYITPSVRTLTTSTGTDKPDPKMTPHALSTNIQQ